MTTYKNLDPRDKRTIETIIWRLHASVIKQMKKIKSGLFSWKEKNETDK
jgi:hypothetical protein